MPARGFRKEESSPGSQRSPRSEDPAPRCPDPVSKPWAAGGGARGRDGAEHWPPGRPASPPPGKEVVRSLRQPREIPSPPGCPPLAGLCLWRRSAPCPWLPHLGRVTLGDRNARIKGVGRCEPQTPRRAGRRRRPRRWSGEQGVPSAESLGRRTGAG